MKFIPAFSVFLFIFISKLHGQDSLYSSRWLIEPGFGVNISITKVLGNFEVDPLFQYDDHSVYYQISGAYYFKQRWGAYMGVHLMKGRNVSGRVNRFAEHLQTTYGDKYYIIPSTGAGYEDSGIDCSRVSIGITYRYNTKKVSIQPKIVMGLYSFNTDWGRALLKEKNSNQELRVDYFAGNIPNDFFMSGLASSFSYSINKRLNIGADIMLSQVRINVDYEKKVTDLITNSVIHQQSIKTRKNPLTLSTGFCLEIKL